MNWKTSLNAVLKAHNKAAASDGKAVSFATQAARREILQQGFNVVLLNKKPLLI